MFVETTISGKTLKALLDTGTSHLLVSSDVASKLGFKISKGGGTAVNSSPTPIDGVAHKVNVSIGEWHGQENLTVVTMDDFDMVLGLKFLDKVKAVLVPYTNTMCILEGKACTVQIKQENVSSKMLLTLQTSKRVRRHEPTFFATIKVEEGSKEGENVPKEIRDVLKDY